MTKRKAATGASQTAASVTGEQNEVVAQNIDAAQADMFNEGAPPAGEPVENVAPQFSMETRPCCLTMEQYMRMDLDTAEVNTPFEYRIVARKNEAGDVQFYINPHDRDGLSRDFEVMGDILKNTTRLAV